jgi:hypothetical protein
LRLLYWLRLRLRRTPLRLLVLLGLLKNNKNIYIKSIDN